MEMAGMPFAPDVLTTQHEAAAARLAELKDKIRRLAELPRLTFQARGSGAAGWIQDRACRRERGS